MSYAVVIPVSNEAKTLESFIQELVEARSSSPYRFDIFFIWDDSSHDQTAQIIREYARKYYFIKSTYYSNSYGVVSCYLHGLKIVQQNYTFAVEMDSGHSHPPKHLTEIFKKLESGHDCVFMSRFLEGSKIKGMPCWRRALSKLGTFIPRLVLGLRFSDTVGGYKGFKLESIQHAINYPHYVPGSGWQIQMKVLCHHLSWIELPYTYQASKSTLKFRWIVWALIGLIRVQKELRTQDSS